MPTAGPAAVGQVLNPRDRQVGNLPHARRRIPWAAWVGVPARVDRRRTLTSKHPGGAGRPRPAKDWRPLRSVGGAAGGPGEGTGEDEDRLTGEGSRDRR